LFYQGPECSGYSKVKQSSSFTKDQNVLDNNYIINKKTEIIKQY